MTSAGDRSCNVYPMRVEGSERGEKMVQRAVDEDVEANAPYFAKRRRIISGERLYLHVCQDVNQATPDSYMYVYIPKLLQRVLQFASIDSTRLIPIEMAKDALPILIIRVDTICYITV